MNCIQILGLKEYGKTKLLKANVEKALEEIALSIRMEEIAEIEKLMEFNITGMPALAIDKVVVLQKTIPTVEELVVLFKHLIEIGLIAQKKD